MIKRGGEGLTRQKKRKRRTSKPNKWEEGAGGEMHADSVKNG